ncbi:MAG: NAD(P)/FAD-dependent oxidoreductase [Kofleriaceae bacterium]|nr:NAD(P)/FAD-dependent oxidoreductase [Kofleriaceae bacterium]
MLYDVVILGGGPAGLSAALALGRARKRVLLCDAGPRRNAAASHVHNFVTRDGTPPEEFRRVGRAQLASYPSVELRDVPARSVTGARGAFQIELAQGVARARRVLLCTGVVDEPLPIEGFVELWGRSIFQCPYCHGWERQDQTWAYLARDAAALPFAVMLRGWTRQVTVFTGDLFEVGEDARAQLVSAGVQLETERVVRLHRRGDQLDGVELGSGRVVACAALFAHPPQRQVDLVRALGPTLDGDGLVQVDPMTRETSVPGVFAAGDLTTRAQGAIFAAATGAQAAGMINHGLTVELAAAGLV